MPKRHVELLLQLTVPMEGPRRGHVTWHVVYIVGRLGQNPRPEPEMDRIHKHMRVSVRVSLTPRSRPNGYGARSFPPAAVAAPHPFGLVPRQQRGCTYLGSMDGGGGGGPLRHLACARCVACVPCRALAQGLHMYAPPRRACTHART